MGSEGGGTGVSLFLGGALTAFQGTVQHSDRDALVMPAKLLPEAGSDSTTEPVYLITRLGTWDAGSSRKLEGREGVRQGMRRTRRRFPWVFVKLQAQLVLGCGTLLLVGITSRSVDSRSSRRGT